MLAETVGLAECLDRLAARKHDDRPISTYRLQFNKEFRFVDAIALIPYLHALGISHCYASPILKARTGSPHGYDITDHNALNPEIGTEEEFYTLVGALRDHGMGLVLDTVPNHMGIGQGDNPWWQDVLENGRASAYADYFDIDWRPLKLELRDKVLFPVLAEQYGDELEHGKICVAWGDDKFEVHYYDKRLPIDPQTIPIIFEPLGDLRTQPVTIPDDERSELENILFALRQLPAHSVTEPQQIRRRQAEASDLKRRMADLVARSHAVWTLIEQALQRLNGEPGNTRSFDALHRLLDAQAYRLAHWRVSGEEINFRRFFDINELIGLSMENARVFAATHRLLRRLLARGCIAGVRIDHPDGLLNPAQYFVRLQMLYAASQCCGADPQSPVAENGIETEVQTIFGEHDWIAQWAPLYVLAEKILEPGEELPTWPVDGTTGYEFANLVNGIQIDSRSKPAFSKLYNRIMDDVLDPDTVIYEGKKLIMNGALASEVAVLTHMLDEISNSDRTARDFTQSALRNVIRETIACFPVYRTYIDTRGNVSNRDRGYINHAIVVAKRRNESTPASVFDFLRSILLLERTPDASNEEYRRWLRFTMKFQQLTGPVMAKGLEDTACYVYNRFASVNDVGGSPREFGRPVEEFHRANLHRLERLPNCMLTTSTHDSKRSEDVRARLNVLSEMPRQWSDAVMRFRRSNRKKKISISDGRIVPDNNEEYLLYQTLVGTWPFHTSNGDHYQDFVQRMQQYMNKAVHEAKVNLSWVNDNPEYVKALEEFVQHILERDEHRRASSFFKQMTQFIAPVSYFGVINSLAQLLLKLTSPGVPDIYRGNELWEFNLVDPDNRRSLNFDHQRHTLNDLLRRGNASGFGALCHELMERYEDGRLKMWTTLRALNYRRENSELFRLGAYVPLTVLNEKQEHIVSFARAYQGKAAIIVAPRFSFTLMKGRLEPPLKDVWGRAELALAPEAAGSGFLNVLTGEVLGPGNGRSLPLREIFANFPVALLSTV